MQFHQNPSLTHHYSLPQFFPFFHLGQTLWRLIQIEGLSGEYLEEEHTELRSQFHSLVAVDFVPAIDVVHDFDILQENDMDELTPIFDYFEDNYVMCRRRGRDRQQPMFPPNT
ncbi:hypothetical protein ANN_22238 [Periplaneta americana]|uniref:Uncharacterized protein n=1 Tax=Periplaneta americana TaxID=6978 RepID=A0ABQ8S7R4_PERAM|nr:hypothetical protein ANN_22238 [Periplaneta americana]